MLIGSSSHKYYQNISTQLVRRLDYFYLVGSEEWCHLKQIIFTAFYSPLVLY